MPDLKFKRTLFDTNVSEIENEAADKDSSQEKSEKERGNESGYYTDFNNTILEHEQDFEVDSINDCCSDSNVEDLNYVKFLEGINSKHDSNQETGRCISSEVERDYTNSVTDSDAFNSEDSYDSQNDPLHFNHQNKDNSDENNDIFSSISEWSSESTTTSPSLSDEDEDQYQTYCYPGYGSRYGQLRYDHKDVIEGIIRKEGSFGLAKIELSTKEREKYEDIWQKIDKIHDDLNKYCEKDEDYYKEREKELDEIIDQALKQGIMFTFPYKGKESFVDRIIDTLKKLCISYTDDQIYEFIYKAKISKIMSEGAYLNEFTRKNHEDYVNKICADRKILKKRDRNISKLKNIAYESVINRSEQTQKENFKVEVDNGYFYIEYEKSSVIELSRIANSKIMEDLDSKSGILQIGESVIRVEKLEEKRNYTDVPQGMIKMSFPIKGEGETEKISIFLYSDKEDSSKVRIELDEENQRKFDKLKNKSSLGKNCFLGGKSVTQAIQDKEFTKHESLKSEILPILPTLLEQTSISNVFSSLNDKRTNLRNILFGG